MKPREFNARNLIKKGVPAVLIPGILAAIAFGWSGKPIDALQNWYASKHVFPSRGIVARVDDGDTIVLSSGRSVRLIGINAPERGSDGFADSTAELKYMLEGKQAYLEYDRYQDDKFGRLLAWVWTGCEKTPTLLPADYMHISKNKSKQGLLENPTGCKKGMLVNEAMVHKGMAVPVVYTDRGELKYEKRIKIAKLE